MILEKKGLFRGESKGEVGCEGLKLETDLMGESKKRYCIYKDNVYWFDLIILDYNWYNEGMKDVDYVTDLINSIGLVECSFLAYSWFLR